ncbi:MAG: TonB-dependent receptor [Polyangiaceae bacterium]
MTILSATELRAMGYPTVVEALRGVRGLFVSDNRAYASVGVRGLSILGDYGQRVLVLLDGHPTNDNYIGSSYTGFDARVDIEDIERIEVIRGPGSVLYGTGAFSGVINLVTKTGRRDRPSGEVGASAVGYGVARARARVDYPFREGGAWLSFAAAHGEGRNFFFPELASAATQNTPAVTGQSNGADGFRAGTANARVWYKSFNLQAFYSSRDKSQPTGIFGTQLGDDATRLRDTRGFIEARVEPKINDRLQVLGRAYYNTYSYRGAYSRVRSDGGLGVDTFKGDWIGAELRTIAQPFASLKVTLGGEAQRHLRAAQTSSDQDGSYLDRDDTFNVAAAYALADVTATKRLRFSGGARLDYYSTFHGVSVNPRVAVIVNPYERGTLKVLAGRAFRAPSVYELHYNDGGLTQIASPSLQPETIYSGEIELTHRFSSTTTALLTGYTNLVKSLIVTEGAGSDTDPLRFANSAADVWIAGAETEVRREWRQGWMFGATYGLQRAVYTGDNASLRRVPNTPTHLGSVKAAAPILSRALTLMTRLSFESGRYDRFDEKGVDRQTHTEPSAIWDVVLSGEESRLNLRYALGVYNAFDWKQRVPVSSDFSQRTLIQNGRTFLLSGAITF